VVGPGCAGHHRNVDGTLGAGRIGGLATSSLGIRNGGCAALITRSFGRFLIISTEYPASYDEHDVQHEANGGGGEANLGEQRQAVPCRDVERLKHVGHESSLSFAGNLQKSRPVAAECQGSCAMSMPDDCAMSTPATPYRRDHDDSSLPVE
jgi:hypothetical protein